jgi:hypothetical protein
MVVRRRSASGIDDSRRPSSLSSAEVMAWYASQSVAVAGSSGGGAYKSLGGTWRGMCTALYATYKSQGSGSCSIRSSASSVVSVVM